MSEPVDPRKSLSTMTRLFGEGAAQEAQQLLAKVKDNQKLLESCALPHDFSVDATPWKKICKFWRCVTCSGQVTEEAKRWYEKGLEHGKASRA